MSAGTTGRSAGESSVRYALLSDIHANLPALEAVLDDLEGRGVTAAYHLGDLVGYAPWPDRVVELLAERGIPGIAGNYDSTVARDHDHCGCRYDDPEQQALARGTRPGRVRRGARGPGRREERPARRVRGAPAGRRHLNGAPAGDGLGTRPPRPVDRLRVTHAPIPSAARTSRPDPRTRG